MKHRFYLFSVCLICSLVASAIPSQTPARLRCEYLQNPLGIAVPKPLLSWTFASGKRNQLQSAYEVLVSNNLADIQRAKGNVWSTGKMSSRQSINIEYGGKGLNPFTRYYWRVKVYNQKGEASVWSEPAWFETAMMNAKDWKGQWIGDGKKQFEKPEDFYGDDPMPLFRKAFDANKKIASARLYVSGLGYYEAYLNGQKISDHVLDPGWTTYKKQALYVTHDITAMVKQGSNVIGFMLGNGWYNPLPLTLFGRFNLRDHQQTGRPCVKAQIRVSYADGSEETIVTDESWQTATGP